MTKTCTKCGLTKPYSDFKKDKRYFLGIGSRCRKCAMSASKEWAKDNPDCVRWKNMICRCYREKNSNFKYYGGRGIEVCDRWRFGEEGMSGHKCFIADMGPPPTHKHQIDRVDNDGNYEPGNVRWATPKENINNRRPIKNKSYEITEYHQPCAV